MNELIICDGCGNRILPGQLRYVLRIEVFAGYEELQISEEDLERDDSAEIMACLEELRNMDPASIQDQVYRNFDYTLCRSCQLRYIENPLHPLSGELEDTPLH